MSSGVRQLFSLRDEQGFTTVGVALAMLITLSLVFTSAQVYRVSSASADVQNVADVAALAAESEVAHFMIVVRACDAVVLSLSLTGVVVTGLGIAALCTPATAGMSETLLKAGRQVIKARNSFAEKATKGLDKLQKALPFFAAAQAAAVAAANNGGPMNAQYQGLAVLVPAQGEPLVIDATDGAEGLGDKADEEAGDIKQAAEEADELAKEASTLKKLAFMHDCGAAPSYCMYERAQTLAGLEGAQNPRYTSVDTWSFSVALARAQTYYATRLATETPQGTSVAEQARSALRTHFYSYAVKEVGKGYVHESDDSFSASFPHLPKNTAQMRQTELYTDACYPLSTTDEGAVTMHAWPGCPQAQTTAGVGSIAQMEAEGLQECSSCEFSASSMGKVAAASSSIENGFEFHYEVVAKAADDYQKVREELDPLTKKVKQKVGGLFDECMEVLKQVGGKRIDAEPPGRLGVVAFVVNLTAAPSSTGFESGFVSESGQLGTRAAVSAATLLEEPSDEGRNVLSSLLDGLKDKAGVDTGALGLALDCWAGLLRAYLDGQDALESTIERVLDSLPLVGESGLGSWAAGAFKKAVGALGLEAAKLDALKPVLVNSAHVAAADNTAFSARFIAVKTKVIENPLGSTDLFSSVVTVAEEAALEGIAGLEGTLEIASVQLFGEGGPSIPLVIVLPPSLLNAASGLVSDIAAAVRSVYAQITGVRVWE